MLHAIIARFFRFAKSGFAYAVATRMGSIPGLRTSRYDSSAIYNFNNLQLNNQSIGIVLIWTFEAVLDKKLMMGK
jgi:hypothetical protein